MRIFKYRLVFVCLSVLLLTSCSKDRLANQVGKWEVIEFYEKYVDGIRVESFTESDTFQINLYADESGQIIYDDGNIINIEWDKYQDEERIVLFEEQIDSLGNYDYIMIHWFEIIEEGKDTQKWLRTWNYFNQTYFEDVWLYRSWYLTEN